VNWGLVANRIVMQPFDTAEEISAVDAIVAHVYSKEPAVEGQRDLDLTTIHETWGADARFEGTGIHVTEWSQSGSSGHFDDRADYGLHQAHEMLNIVEAFIAQGVTAAQVWPLIQNTPNALSSGFEFTALNAPGVFFRMMADASYSPRLTALRLCFSAGTALPRETFDTFHERFGVPVRQLYGCTEAGALTINLDEDPTPTAESVGRPLNGVSVEVKDETDAVVPPGVTGEVVVRTAAMTRGYHGMDDHNSEVFRNGAYRTGDVGHLDADGRLWLTGRKKLFIEVVGNKVDPAEVEDALSTHPAVQESVVVGIPSAIAGEELIKAVVVAASPIEEEALIEHCADRLASFKVPALVEFRDEIPRSPLGKVLRKYLV